MSTLVIVRDPIQSTSKREVRVLPDGMMLIDVLERNFAPGFDGIETDVYLNGRKIDSGDDAAHARKLAADDVVAVVHRPSGVELAIIAVIAIVAAVAVVALTPTPAIPNDQGQSSDSPNNNLSGQTNLARPYQAIPQIMGQIYSYPDLVQPAVYEYVDDIKRVNELFCIGIGEFNVEAVRSELSNLGDIPGSSYRIYPPGSYPNDLRIARSTAEVDGQELDPRSNGALQWVGWFQLPDVADEIWCQFQLPQGLRTEDGKRFTQRWRIEFQEVNIGGSPIGSVQSVTASRTEKTFDPLFQTVKIGVSRGYYRVRAAKAEDKPRNIDQDQVKWEDAQAIQYYDGSNFGDVTLLEVNTKATEFASAQSSRKINALVTRRLPTWSESGGYDSSLTATRRFADAVLYTLHTLGNVPLENIDLEGLYDIQESLDSINAQLGRFDYSFDDEGISLGDRVATICNCVRVLPYREGQMWRFVREEAKPQAVSVFNRRNISAGGNQSQTYLLRQPDEYDGVIVSYTDPTTDKKREVNLTAYANGDIEEGVSQNPNEFELSGCRSEIQALDRANMEARRILYQRRTVTETVLTDGYYVNIGDRVRWVDIYDNAVGDGEIMAHNGDVYETSEIIPWEDGVTFYVAMTDADGYPFDITVAERVSDTSFRTSELNVSIADWSTVQAGSRYIIGPLDESAATDFVVKSKTPQDTGHVELELINYDARMFAEDGGLNPGGGGAVYATIMADGTDDYDDVTFPSRVVGAWIASNTALMSDGAQAYRIQGG